MVAIFRPWAKAHFEQWAKAHFKEWVESPLLSNGQTPTRTMNESPVAVVPAPAISLTPTGVEDGYYGILAGGARYALFCSLVDLNLPALIATGPMTAAEIVAALTLDA